MLLLTKIIYRFNENPINIPIAIFIKREKTILKFVQNHKRQKKKSKECWERRLDWKYYTICNIVLDFKPYYKAIIVNSVVLE